jgi:hypothetical protein
MGYEYTIRGWFKADAPVDVSRLSHHEQNPEHGLRTTGAARNYVVFGTESKWQVNAYVDWLSELVQQTNGLGLMTITGEVLYDGEDRIVVARNGQLRTLPLFHLYDVQSAWNELYHWSHYMGRETAQLQPTHHDALATAFAGRRSLKGWLKLPYRTAAGPLVQELQQRAGLGDGVAELDGLSNHLLFGVDVDHADETVAAIIELTARHAESYGVLYGASSDEQEQRPIAFEAGRMKLLPAVHLGDCADGIPTRRRSSDWRLPRSSSFHLRGTGSLRRLATVVQQATGATTLDAGDDGWRSSEGYESCLFRTPELTMMLATAPDSGQPVLVVWLEVEGAAEALHERSTRLAEQLRQAGIEASPSS